MDVRAKLIELLDDIFSTDIPTPTEAIADGRCGKCGVNNSSALAGRGQRRRYLSGA